MDDLVAFVRARLDEDERELAKDPPKGLGYADLGARMRREVWAKRKIIEVYEAASASDDPATDHSIGMATMRMVLRSYAAVWSDHPGYRQEWAP